MPLPIAASLRRRLLTLPAAGGGDVGALLAGDAGEDAAPGDGRVTPASVLVPIVLRQPTPTLLLTRRTEHLRDHPGQISFPGGRVEESDASPEHTALREAAEEIGLDSTHVEVLGFLPDYRTVTGFCITPVVALLTPPFALTPDPFEVAEIFEVPLSFVLDPANHQRHPYTWQNRSGHYDAIPWGDYYIWGATAGMIRSLAALLRE